MPRRVLGALATAIAVSTACEPSLPTESAPSPALEEPAVSLAAAATARNRFVRLPLGQRAALVKFLRGL